jgi:O-antigen/teichoic acid export membrane protein
MEHPEETPFPADPGTDEAYAVGAALADPAAGGRAIRGGALRVSGYLLGILATAAASVVLLRYLGVDDFGRWVTVTALIGIVTAVSDAGLTVVGQREYIALRETTRQRSLLADLVGLRTVLTPIGVAIAVVFAWVVGYTPAMVAGTLLVGIGLFFASLASALTIPLTAKLRVGAVTAAELIRNLAIALGVIVLAWAGAGFVAFFTPHLVGGVAALMLVLVLLGRGGWVVPRLHWARWRPLVLTTLPIALSLVINQLYLRVLVIEMSLMSTVRETGLYSTSFRVIEIFIGVPTLMVGVAFPILAHAAPASEARLSYAIQRLLQVALLISIALALALSFAAEPIVVLLGGTAYKASGTVLAIQAYALVGAFVTQVATFGLVSVGRERALIAINALALVIVGVLGGVLIPLYEANGAAVAAVIGEAALSLTGIAMLVRARPAVGPRWRPLARLGLAFAAGAACAALVPQSGFIRGVVASGVFIVSALALRAVPMELLHAFRATQRSASSA